MSAVSATSFTVISSSSLFCQQLCQAYPDCMFLAYHDGQPFNENMFRPCPMLENPGKLQEMVEKSGARSTDMQSPEPVENLTKKCQPYAENWTPTAGRLWSCSPKCKGCGQREEK